MNIKKIFFILPLLCLAACSSDDEGSSSNSSQQPQGNGVPIMIEVSEEPLCGSEGTGTRAAITYKETLSKFYFRYITETPKSFNEAEASRTDANHSWESNSMWPSNVDPSNSCYFFAYANVDYDGNDYSKFNYDSEDNYKIADQSLDFNIDELSNGQMDLLVSTQVCSQKENQVDKKPVHFLFKHACAALQFSISKTAALGNFQIRVNEVKLFNITQNGTYKFSDGSWKTFLIRENNVVKIEDSYADYTLYSSDDGFLVKNETASDAPTLLAKDANDYMFVIPQTVTAWTPNPDTHKPTISENDKLEAPGSYIRIKCEILKGNKDYSDSGYVYLPFSDTWEKGVIHRYTVRMGTNLRKSNGEKINFTN